ncbi:MAG: nitroreductase [Alphaproteobacteria bacterium]|nr:nitroreductase [Alphaproteobacteria bacterium]
MSDIQNFLQTRRSVPLKQMLEPAPSDTQLQEILQIAARVPDHGRMCPWYFIIIKGEQRAELGQKLKDIYIAQNPQAEDKEISLEEGRFMRAPLCVAVVSRIKKGKHPQWEQILSAGAVCMNLCHAANAHGFATNWLTEWCAYDTEFKKVLGVDEPDNIAGFIYIGTSAEKPAERERPELNEISSVWSNGVILATGDKYGNTLEEWPKTGFSIKKNPLK